MQVVYKAIDLQENKYVALKRLRSDEDSNGLPSRALREFTLLKTLQVPPSQYFLFYFFVLISSIYK